MAIIYRKSNLNLSISMKVFHETMHKVRLSSEPIFQTVFTIRVLITDSVSGWAGWVLAHPKFGISVNPIPHWGGRLCPPYYCLPTPTPPALENLTTSRDNMILCATLHFCFYQQTLVNGLWKGRILIEEIRYFCNTLFFVRKSRTKVI